ncbi:MAG: response regulator transcription factor [Anaerolineae bacterium]|nr:response regulator transcription factor [Thermoflexales bacterium]MDW8395648.1 response regulator transcription factor [Anaerolineae bacterium]
MISLVRVLVVEDDAFNREGIRQYLSLHGFEVLGAGDRRSAWELIQTQQPQAAVVDLVIPEHPGVRARQTDTHGMSLVQQIKASYPGVGVVVFSAFDDRALELARLIGQGVGGIAYLLKGCLPEAMLNALRAVMKGRVVVDPDLSQPNRLARLILDQMDPLEREFVEVALQHLHTLSKRQLQIARHIQHGFTTQAIAEVASLTKHTVENVSHEIYQKLHLNHAPAKLRPLVLLVKVMLLSDVLYGDRAELQAYDPSDADLAD